MCRFGTLAEQWTTDDQADRTKEISKVHPGQLCFIHKRENERNNETNSENTFCLESAEISKAKRMRTYGINLENRQVR